MRCPFCNQDNTRVVDSRPIEDSNAIRRRRMCDVCGRRFTTYEKVETIPLIVIKKDMNREQYDRSKIETGILRACHKRPVAAEKINEMVNKVETELFNGEEREIPSSVIGEKVMHYLKDLEGRQHVHGRAEKDARQIAGGKKWKCRTILKCVIRCRNVF